MRPLRPLSPLSPLHPLPPLLVVTDGLRAARPLVEVVAASVAAGARAVLLREKHLARPARALLAEQLGELLHAAGGVLLVASDPTIVADGVHLAAADPWPVGLNGRTGLTGLTGRSGRTGGSGRTGRSCHSPADVARAAAEGCDYATLSPLYPSASKPGYGPPLGPAALAGLALPTWALGGVGAGNAGACVAAGAAGVAVMGAIMGADDPAAATAAILHELGEAPA